MIIVLTEPPLYTLSDQTLSHILPRHPSAMKGANLNPMVAYGWLYYDLEGKGLYRHVKDIEYILVYIVSPILGGGFGAVAYR